MQTWREQNKHVYFLDTIEYFFCNSFNYLYQQARSANLENHLANNHNSAALASAAIVEERTLATAVLNNDQIPNSPPGGASTPTDRLVWNITSTCEVVAILPKKNFFCYWSVNVTRIFFIQILCRKYVSFYIVFSYMY